MKKLLLVLMLGMASSVSAMASQCTAICDSIPFASDKLKCVQQLSQGASYEEAACGVCASIPFTNDKISCLSAIENRAYNPSILNTCASMVFTDKKIECLATTGTTFDPMSDICDTRKLSRQVDGVISNLKGGNLQAALRTLIKMRTALDRCN